MKYVTPEMELVELKSAEIATVESSGSLNEEDTPGIDGSGSGW